MTYREFYDKIKEVCIENDSYNYIGVRFENKVREIGETCENSKHNIYREDERDFPEFGTEEYNDMLELDGTSSWLVYDSMFDWADEIEPSNNPGIALRGKSMDDEMFTEAEHAYMIAGSRINNHSDADNGEAVIENAVVIDIIY